MKRTVTGGSSETEPDSGWLGASKHVFSSILRANKATLTSLGFDGRRTNRASQSDVETLAATGADDWEFVKSVEKKDEIAAGDYVEFTKTITDEDVRGFAEASGDTNPLHLDEGFAEKTRFDGRIVHGTLVSGLVSAALARLPGLSVYVSQDTRFLGPVEVGDRVTARCEVLEETNEDMFRLSTVVYDEDGESVIEGEAVVLVEEIPE